MIVLGGGVMLLFFLTEQLFPLCTDQLNLSTVLKSLGVLLFSAVMAERSECLQSGSDI